MTAPVDGLAAFEAAAASYERWYESPAGRRAARAEQALLGELLREWSEPLDILEVGCGTGHFTRWLAGIGHRVTGLDRSRRMLEECTRLGSAGPLVQGDAHALPFRSRAFDLSVLITTLEFLDEPAGALREAVRIARRGVVVVVLNRHSLGAVRRRVRGGALLGRARDRSRTEVATLLRDAARPRLQALRLRYGLPPFPLPVAWALPGSAVLGARAVLVD